MAHHLDGELNAGSWQKPPRVIPVDPRMVANPEQARVLIDAVSYAGGYERGRGRRLMGPFAGMYYAGLRPAYASDRRTQMPVLQFMWESAHGTVDEPKWWLVNVGTGPATNVVVAQALRTALGCGPSRETWFNPVLVPSIPAGGRPALTWLGGTQGLDCGLGASCTDVNRFFYTTKCGDDVSMFLVGSHLPRWPLLKLNGVKVVKTWWG